ncbi:diguanylate cyclase domain-containing protein [Bradyrhizobium liaoningense]|uniref:diguanylate cyclase domain-containing protein n=1 Tax=Bradyrhizobium liaoningense TaxID=43992 RepID=UPI001BA6AEEE|nr:diguanylate cyclase [Bradyrhizobium liaoningense]MBR1170232.1 diguanylate cyclase [Bradyrhizobium liaoningense]
MTKALRTRNVRRGEARLTLATTVTSYRFARRYERAEGQGTTYCSNRRIRPNAFGSVRIHQADDGCLQRIAEVIGSATANTGGLASRYCRDESAVVLPGVKEDGAVMVADAIRLLVQLR